ncbi:MAG: hypothetical protein K0S65_2817, partial [Labilithrix sp.]|nr:hypothetical protein [Labilithrix sp.]
MRSKRIHAAAVASVLVTLCGPAFADPSLADRETARSQMDEGDKKRDAGDLKGALRNYETADAIMKVPTTGLEVARAQVALGMLLEARETLGRVMRTPAKPGEPAPFAAARKSAEALNNDLSTRIPSIQVVLTNGDPAQPPQISVDGEAIPPAAANAPRRVNPGPHVVVVKAGTVERRFDIAVVERDTKTLPVDLKEQTAVAPKKESSADPPEATTTTKSTPKLLMYGGFGVAVVGLGVGAVTGLMSLSKTSELKDVCPNDRCPAGRQDEIDSAKSLGNISTIAFVVGGVGLGVGVVGLVMSRGDKQESSPTAAARPRRPASPFAPENVRA